MVNASKCEKNYLFEWYDENKTLQKKGPATSAATACVHILDLSTIHPLAKGFRRGFNGYPFGYLAAGAFSVVVRLNLENFGLHTTKLVDLSSIDSTFGGYSGGFADGPWSCFA